MAFVRKIFFRSVLFSPIRSRTSSLITLNILRIFGPKRDENGQWRRLHNEELHSLYRSPNIVRVIKSRRLRWAGQVARMEEDNIRMDLEEIGINSGNWVDSAQDRDYWRALVNATLNLRVP